MRKFVKKTVVAIMTAAMVVSSFGTTGMVAKAAPSGYVLQNKTVQELMSAYGIIAFDYADIGVHCHSNFMVDTVSMSSNSGLKQDYDTVEDFYFKEAKKLNSQICEEYYADKDTVYTSAEVVKVNDNQNQVTLMDGSSQIINRPRTFVTDSDIAAQGQYAKYVDLADVQKKFIAYNKAMSKQEDNATLDIFNTTDMNNRYMTVGAGTTYLTVTCDDLIDPTTRIYYDFSDYNNDDVLVLNVDLKGESDVHFGGMVLRNNGQSINCAEANFANKYNRIFYNFYDSGKADGQYRGKVSFDAEGFGTIIAPCATVSLSSNWDGTVVANNVALTSGQYHRVNGTNIPAPKVSTEATTSTQEEVTTSTQEEVTTSTQEEVTTSTQEEVTTSTQEEVTTSTQEEATTSTREETTTSTREETTTSTREEATTSTREEATTSTREEATTSTREEATTSTREEATTSTREEATTSTREEATTSTREEATTSTEQKQETTTEKPSDSKEENNTTEADKPSSSKDTADLTINVKDEETDEPVPGATVEITTPDGEKTQHVTDEDGNVTIKDVPEGEYKVVIKDVPEEYNVTTNKEVKVKVKKGKTTKKTVTKKKNTAYRKQVKKDAKNANKAMKWAAAIKTGDDAYAEAINAKEVETTQYGAKNNKSISKKYNKSLKKFKKKYKKQSKEIAAWITIAGTKINYPVMYTGLKDNDKYLQKNIKGERDTHGMLFASYMTPKRKITYNTVIYGHNMKDGTMFTDLTKYASKSFYNTHKYVKFSTQGYNYVYEVVEVARVSCKSGSKDRMIYQRFCQLNNKKTFKKWQKQVAKNREYKCSGKYKRTDKLMMLSTCEYTKENGRFIVICKQIKCKKVK